MTIANHDRYARQQALQGRLRGARLRLLKARGRREMPVSAGADPVTLAQAIDSTLGAALAQRDAGADDRAWQLVAAAGATASALLEALGTPDPDHMGDQP